MTGSRTATGSHLPGDLVGESLRGEHERFATWIGQIGRYDTDVAPFVCHPRRLNCEDWEHLSAAVGSGGSASLLGSGHMPPSGWTVAGTAGSVRMTGATKLGLPYPDLCRLTEADVPEMLALVRRTRPGPFSQRTIETGTYLGVRVDGGLVAMAGERLRPQGWTEISAVCVASDFRGRGYAERLVSALSRRILDQNKRPFLQVHHRNTAAIGLYKKLGFEIEGYSESTIVQAPWSNSRSRAGVPQFIDQHGLLT